MRRLAMCMHLLAWVPGSADAGEANRLAWIPEAAAYTLVYDLDLSRLGRTIDYQTDRHAQVTGPFDRIAYLLELEERGRMVHFVWASMDAFTADPGRIGIPTGASKAFFQQAVRHLRVESNAAAVTSGEVDAGNIEFWPDNYLPINSGHVPGASDTLYDGGDQPHEPKDGYGSMQVHNTAARQTIFAINHWREGGALADVGMGNAPSGNPDWTFAANGGSYGTRRLRIFVRARP